MRFWILCMLMSLCLLAQPSGGLFPIPPMQEQWSGSGLSDSENKMLEKPVKADVSCEASARGDDMEFELARVELGNVGKGVLVRAHNLCSCGATGNCDIHLYVQRHGKYAQIPFCESVNKAADCEGPSGWAFAVVKSDSAVPDLVFASNSSAGENDLTLYRYEKGSFILHRCERLLAKGDGTPKSWWDPSEVEVRACGGP